jgi:hypothetical protein
VVSTWTKRGERGEEKRGVYLFVEAMQQDPVTLLVKILKINNTIKKFSQVQLFTSHPLNLNQHTTQAAMILSGIT